MRLPIEEIRNNNQAIVSTFLDLIPNDSRREYDKIRGMFIDVRKDYFELKMMEREKKKLIDDLEELDRLHLAKENYSGEPFSPGYTNTELERRLKYFEVREDVADKIYQIQVKRKELEAKHKKIFDMVNILPQVNYRAMLNMRYKELLTEEEIAEELNLDFSTVHKGIIRAINIIIRICH